MQLYRNFESQADIDAQYNAGSRVPDSADWMNWYRATSEQVRGQLDYQVHRFGPTTSEYLEIYPAANPAAPLAVFIHGGYWRAGSASDFSFVASGLHARGFCVAVNNYSLCPQVSIDEITRQSRAAVAWLHQYAADFNADPDNIIVAGHSAGGQQVAMLLATNWQADYDLPMNLINAAIPISGVFDLRPLRYSYLQPTLCLSHETITRQSPQRLVPLNHARVLVTVGGAESDEFLRQSKQYHEWCLLHDLPCQLWMQPELHHFNAIEGLFQPHSALLDKVVELAAG